MATAAISNLQRVLSRNHNMNRHRYELEPDYGPSYITFESLLYMPSPPNFNIVLNGQTLLCVHKFVFIGKNNYFSKLLKDNPNEDTIEFVNDSESFINFIIYMYTNTIKDCTLKPNLLRTAYRLREKKLMNACIEKFMNNINKNTVVEYYVAAVDCCCNELKELTIQYLAKMDLTHLCRRTDFSQILCQSDIAKYQYFRKFHRDNNYIKKKMFNGNKQITLCDISQVVVGNIYYHSIFCVANVPWRIYYQRKYHEHKQVDYLHVGLIFEGDSSIVCNVGVSFKLLPFRIDTRERSSAHTMQQFSSQERIYEWPILPFNTILNEENGFICNDMITIELDLEFLDQNWCI